MKKYILQIIIIIAFNSQSDELTFNINALESTDRELVYNDILTNFNDVIPGDYYVDIFINNQFKTSENIKFIISNNSLIPLFTYQQIIGLGIKQDIINDIKNTNQSADIDLKKLIPYCNYNIDLNQLKLHLSIPQIAISKSQKEVISPEKWDNGLPAFFTEYQLSGNTRFNHPSGTSDHFLSLKSGLNLAEWRIRYGSFYNQKDNHWSNTQATLSRHFSSIKSQLTVGKNYLNTHFITPFSFEGVSLQSDESMYSQYEREYSPVIADIARTAAKIIIKQNNIVIYQAYLPAGPFIIDDIQPLSNRGVLNVIIQESDGTEREYDYFFSALLPMLKKDQFRYSVNLGRYSSMTAKKNNPEFIHGQFSRGITNELTFYSSLLLSPNYQSLLVGSSVSLQQFGALSADITQHKTKQNQSNTISVEYSKRFITFDTNLSLGGYWFSDPSLTSFTDSLEQGYKLNNKSSMVKVTINQNFIDWGFLNLSLMRNNYLHQDSEAIFNIGYTTSIKDIYFNLNYSDQLLKYDKQKEQIYSLNIILPLRKWLNGSYLTYQTQYLPDRNHLNQIGLSGSLNKDSTLNYNFNHTLNHTLSSQQDHRVDKYPSSSHCCYKKGYSNQSQLYIQYTSNKFIFNTGYDYQSNRHKINYGLRGAIIVHPYGYTLGSSLGETAALIITNNIENIKLDNYHNIYTDSDGQAIIPNLSPYRTNLLALNTASFPQDIEIPTTHKSLIPTRGAIVLANYLPHQGKKVFFTLQLANGKPIPFGAIANVVMPNTQDKRKHIISGILDDNGQLYLSGLANSGHIQIKWGKSKQSSCMVNYKIPENINKAHIYQLTEVCINEGAL